MNKTYAGLSLLLLAACTQPSSLKEIRTIESVATIEDAYKVSQKYPVIRLQELNSAKDTSALSQQLFKLKQGDTATINGTYYKIVRDTGDFTFRASYVYLDAARLSQEKIDSLRKLIKEQAEAGKPFEELVDKYNMDENNKKHGDTGPFQAGMMVKPFEDAVRAHQKNEIFYVDVPEKKWYYVVKKTTDNEGETIRVILSVKKAG